MDNVDKKILALLQKDGKLSNAKLAEKLNMSETPCWRRVKRLENEPSEPEQTKARVWRAGVCTAHLHSP